MQTHAGSVVAHRLSEEGWQPFGWLPVADTDPRDGRHRLDFEWNDAHVNLIHHDRSEVTATEHGLVCEMMFHHRTHTQALLVLNCPAVIAVAAADVPLAEDGPLGLVRAFLLDPGDALVLDRSTWHWGPFPITAPRVDCYNVQGLRYAEDNECFDFARSGTAFEVVTDRGLAR